MPRLQGTDPNTGQISEQSVRADGEALVRAIVESDFEHASEKDEEAYTLHSTYNATGGQEVIYLQNTSEFKVIHIVRNTISTAASGVATLFRVTSATAAGGTAITPLNLNLGSTVRTVNAFGNAEVTGSLSGDTIDAQDIGTSVPYSFNFGGALILKQNEAVAITLAESAIFFATFYYHFED